MDLAQVVGELYSQPAGAFTERREELTRQASRDGDRRLAAEIRKLRRPTTSAALINALAHRAADLLREYLEVAEQLRAAQADLAGDRMKELSRQRQKAAAALVERAVRLAGKPVGEPVRRELEETLRAAVADPAAAQVIASGHLTRSLAYAGFGEVDITAATATPLTAPATVPSPASRSGQPPSDIAAQTVKRQRKAAEAQVVQAQEQADEAASAAEAARERAERATAQLGEAAALVADLQDRLTRARATQRGAKQECDIATAEAKRALRAREPAQRDLDRARRHARSLQD